MAINNVAILGGVTGRLGPWLLQALVDSKLFNVTVLQRHESTSELDSSKYPNVQVKKLPVNYVEETGELAGVLRGQDALVSVIPSSATREHLALAAACCIANVQRMIPADYGSVDSSDRVCVDTLPLYTQKKNTRDAMQGLTLMYPAFSWTSLICGHFLDHGLESGLFGHDLARSPPLARVFDSGDIKWSASTRSRIGRAVVKILSPECLEQTKNKLVYIQSVNISQNELLAAFERASGKKFEVERLDSAKYLIEKKAEYEKGPNHEVREEIVGVLGVTRANWERQPTFFNRVFGFEDEGLDDIVKTAWENAGKS